MRQNVFAAMFLSLLAFAQISVGAKPKDTVPQPVLTGSPGVSQFNMVSTNTGRTYRVQIFKPQVPAPPSGYPVIYVTDGNSNFQLAAGQMFGRQYVDLNPAIVVGLSYPSDDILDFVRLRMKDLTPEKPTGDFLPIFQEWAKFGKATLEDSGGAEGFFRFITEELRPKLAATFPLDAANQTLYGHSLGGLFTLHVLFHHTRAFSTYVASSPSILYNERSIIQGEQDFKATVEKGEAHPRVLLLVGGLENYPPAEQLAAMPAEQVLRWAKMGRAIDNTLEMAARLRRIKGPPGYEVQSHVFEDENHMSVVPAALSRALTFSLSRMPQ